MGEEARASGWEAEGIVGGGVRRGGGLPAAHGEQVEAEVAPSSAEYLPAKPPAPR